MPLYKFQCKDCAEVFEVRASIQEKEAGLHPECPHCHCLHTQQILTAGVMLHTARGARQTSPACGCNSNDATGCCRQ